MQIINNPSCQRGGITLVLSCIFLIAGGLESSSYLLAQDLPFAPSMSVSGDSTSRAFNANDQVSCPFGDQVQFSWATGGAGFLSHRQLLADGLGKDLVDGSTVFNHARSGSRLLDDFFNQASAIRRALTAAPAPRYVPVFFGHNDACSDRSQREGSDCGSPDRDPSNYCRTRPAAFEREFRRGMDELIQIPDSRIQINALARLSQYCNAADKTNCLLKPFLTFSCRTFWEVTQFVCSSLTSDCSPQRKIDMYNTVVAYNAVLRRVTAEYVAIPEGGRSSTGAVKASGVLIRFVEAGFYAKFNEDYVSCCDCFHPNVDGHSVVASTLWYGLQCSEETPCCANTGDPLMDATCARLDTQSTYPGGFWQE